jgi:tetratricopeptide (TPR) repeat protein
LSYRFRYIRGTWISVILGSICLTVSLAALAQNEQRQVAFSLEQQGKYSEAESVWQTLARTYPTNAEPYAHMGLLEARQEHFAQAVTFYRKAMKLNPQMQGLRLNLGLALFKNGDYQQAIEIFTPLSRALPAGSPDAQQLRILMGMAHYGLGQYALAIPFLQLASANDEQNLPLLLDLAHSCLLAKQFPCVLSAFHKLIAANAESAEADMLVGEALDEMKDTNGALRELHAAAAINSKLPNVHFGLGYLQWTQGQYAEAAKEFQAELANDPDHVQAALYLADSKIQMNQMDEARSLLENLVKVNPGSPMEHLDLGIVYADANRKDDALHEFQTAAQLAPDNVNAHWRLARLYRSMGKTTEAIAEFDKAGKLNKAADDGLLKVMSRIPAKDTTSQKPSGSATK